MCTVGYGDISATNNLELGVSIINILFACLMFAHAVKKKKNSNLLSILK